MIAAGFLFVMTQIRLGFLLPKVMLGALLFVPAGSVVDEWLGHFSTVEVCSQTASSELGSALMAGCLLLYLVLLPLAKFCQWYNFLEGKTLYRPLQTFLEAWCNNFGIIIWRVFSVDVINFFVRVYKVGADGEEEEYTTFGRWDGPGTRGRYVQVAESIALTCIFTTLKYHPANSSLFVDKLVRYARTIPCPEGSKIRFAYYSIDHTRPHFEFLHHNDYLVDPVGGGVETLCSAGGEVPDVSPVRESARTGSYLPIYSSAQ